MATQGQPQSSSSSTICRHLWDQYQPIRHALLSLPPTNQNLRDICRRPRCVHKANVPRSDIQTCQVKHHSVTGSNHFFSMHYSCCSPNFVMLNNIIISFITISDIAAKIVPFCSIYNAGWREWDLWYLCIYWPFWAEHLLLQCMPAQKLSYVLR